MNPTNSGFNTNEPREQQGAQGWTLDPWRYPLGETGDYDSGINLKRGGKTIAQITEECTDEEAELIARAPSLLSENEQLRGEVETLRVKAANWDKLEPAKKLLALSEGKQADMKWLYTKEIDAQAEEIKRLKEENERLEMLVQLQGKIGLADEDEINEYRNTLLNCLTQFEFYVDATEFKDSGTAAIKHIESLLLKYGHD